MRLKGLKVIKVLSLFLLIALLSWESSYLHSPKSFSLSTTLSYNTLRSRSSIGEVLQGIEDSEKTSPEEVKEAVEMIQAWVRKEGKGARLAEVKSDVESYRDKLSQVQKQIEEIEERWGGLRTLEVKPMGKGGILDLIEGEGPNWIDTFRLRGLRLDRDTLYFIGGYGSNIVPINLETAKVDTSKFGGTGRLGDIEIKFRSGEAISYSPYFIGSREAIPLWSVLYVLRNDLLFFVNVASGKVDTSKGYSGNGYLSDRALGDVFGMQLVFDALCAYGTFNPVISFINLKTGRRHVKKGSKGILKVPVEGTADGYYISAMSEPVGDIVSAIGYDKIFFMNGRTGQWDLTKGKNGVFSHPKFKGGYDPFILHETLYVPCEKENRIFAIDPRTGDLDRSKFNGMGILEGKSFIRRPAKVSGVAHESYDVLFVSNADGSLAAVNVKTGEPETSLFTNGIFDDPRFLPKEASVLYTLGNKILYMGRVMPSPKTPKEYEVLLQFDAEAGKLLTEPVKVYLSGNQEQQPPPEIGERWASLKAEEERLLSYSSSYGEHGGARLSLPASNQAIDSLRPLFAKGIKRIKKNKPIPFHVAGGTFYFKAHKNGIRFFETSNLLSKILLQEKKLLEASKLLYEKAKRKTHFQAQRPVIFRITTHQRLSSREIHFFRKKFEALKAFAGGGVYLQFAVYHRKKLRLYGPSDEVYFLKDENPALVIVSNPTPRILKEAKNLKAGFASLPLLGKKTLYPLISIFTLHTLIHRFTQPTEEMTSIWRQKGNSRTPFEEAFPSLREVTRPSFRLYRETLSFEPLPQLKEKLYHEYLTYEMTARMA